MIIKYYEYIQCSTYSKDYTADLKNLTCSSIKNILSQKNDFFISHINYFFRKDMHLICP